MKMQLVETHQKFVAPRAFMIPMQQYGGRSVPALLRSVPRRQAPAPELTEGSISMALIDRSS
ncbi:hypothetical protein QA640_36080 [Bradyrhizobium sp. CB82]|uniref:hypothetical protein n=1 Tax=Bradyrhizobium sp. CB82 TaxID=3039159 RepID=UPI0024B1E45D|nr:hypothetical protein [Bradyrhizobium sp. CB82]WFU39720.1 hypothetical protein QA640_36080 [Bradyrhizobium sp. CB82]